MVTNLIPFVTELFLQFGIRCVYNSYVNDAKGRCGMKIQKWLALVMGLILLFSCSSLSMIPAAQAEGETVVVSSPDAARILETRFLNMLNHNFAYNGSFSSTEALIGDASLALLSVAEGEEDVYIAEAYIRDYVNDMYGVRIEDFSAYSPSAYQKPGYVYVVPRGYSVYRHESPRVTEHEDGSYTVVTDVTVTTHEGEEIRATAVTLFAKAEGSRFGFHILYSDLTENTLTV